MKTTAVSTTPAATPPIATNDKVDAARAAFMSAAMNMSWQLAIVVLVPILGGFKLDDVLGWTPVLTILGFVLAIAGMSIVVKRQLELYSPKITAADIANAKKIRDAEADE